MERIEKARQLGNSLHTSTGSTSTARANKARETKALRETFSTSTTPHYSGTFGASENPLYTETYSSSENPLYTDTYGDSSFWSSTDNSQSRRPKVTRNDGRPTAVVFLLGMVVSLMLVLYTSQLMTEKREEKTNTFIASDVRILTSGFVVLSIISMVIFVCIPGDRSDVIPGTPGSTFRVIVLYVLAIFSVAGLTIKLVILTDKTKSFDYSTGVNIQMYAAIYLFCTLQPLFIWHYRKWKCLSWKLKIPLGILVSSNLCLSIGASFSFADDLENNIGNDSFPACEELDFHKKAAVDRLNAVFVFGFCILSVQMLGEIWDVWTKDDLSSTYTRVQSSGNFEVSGSNRLFAKLKRVLVLTLKFVCKHVIIWSGLLCLGVLAFHIVATDKNLLFIDQSCVACNMSDPDPQLEDIHFYISSVFYYAFCTISVIGFICTVKKPTRNGSYSSDDVLLLVSGFGQVVLVMFQIIDVCVSLSTDYDQDLSLKVSYLFKALFHTLSLFCQTYIILKYSGCAQTLDSSGGRDFFIRMVVAFLMVTNADRWVRILLFSPTVSEYIDVIGNGEDTFGKADWCQISKLLIPVCAFYRLLSTIMCFDIYSLSRRE